MVNTLYNIFTNTFVAVDVMMAWAKRIYLLMIKVNKLFFLSWYMYMYFLRKIENIFAIFLSSYKNICESLEELEKVVEKLP